MKRIIIIVWVLSLTLTIFAQGNKNLRDHQMTMEKRSNAC